MVAIRGVGYYLLACTVRSVSTGMAWRVAARLWTGGAAAIEVRRIPSPAKGVRILGRLQAGSWWVRRVEPTVLGIVTWGGGPSNSGSCERLVMSSRAYRGRIRRIDIVVFVTFPLPRVFVFFLG